MRAACRVRDTHTCRADFAEKRDLQRDLIAGCVSFAVYGHIHVRSVCCDIRINIQKQRSIFA